MDFAGFLNLIDASYIYDGGKNMALFVATVITPVLLVVAIWIRLGQTQLEATTSGRGKWGVFLKDMAVWLTILGLYFTLAGMLSDVFNLLYDYFQKQGSLGAIQTHFIKMIDEIDGRSSEGQGILNYSFDVMGNLVMFTIWLIYYGSFLLATFLITFLKMAHALSWSFALVWGLIAIPMSLIGSFKLLRGWAIFTGVVLLWPLFHFGGFALFNPVFEHAANNFVTGDGAGLASIDKAQLYLVMTFVNLLSVAIALAAPFIAQAFVSNSGSIAGVVTPFALAATSMAGAGMMEMRQRLQGGGRAVGDVSKGIANGFTAGKTPISGTKGGLSRATSSSANHAARPGPVVSKTTAEKFMSEKSSVASGTQSSVAKSAPQSDNKGGQVDGPAPLIGSPGSRESASSLDANRDTSPNDSATSSESSKAQIAAKAAHISMAEASASRPLSVASTSALDDAEQTHGRGNDGKAAQARRGAVLNQKHNAGKIKLKGRK